MTPSSIVQCHILTPPGAGAIGIIRVRGSAAPEIVAKLCRSPAGHAFVPPGSDDVRLSRVVQDGQTLDDALVSRVAGDSVPAFDLCLHGGVGVLTLTIDALKGLGIIPANIPHNIAFHTLDVIEREAAALIRSAPTPAAVEMLAWQRAHLPGVLRRVERDWATDEPAARAQLLAMRRRYSAARWLIEGCRVALVGPVNSGKSSLLNRFAGREAALVSSSPGTTRDWVSETVILGGVAVTLVDTAGANPTAVGTEKQAIEARGGLVESCDLEWRVLDGSRPETWSACLDSPSRGDLAPRRIRVFNKSDLLGANPRKFTSDEGPKSQERQVCVSALSGHGLETLAALTLEAIGFDNAALRAPTLFTKRQRRIADEILSFDSADDLRARRGVATFWRRFSVADENAGL